ncbi:zinc finger X-linked protein ZXDA isoform X2 [Latimeria chalumnae]|uniref:zinc finger X-linked protein ZXDA isoform X2 n=1 Tax=Latimeria chalumnae TaxID=7897 RepID=UPI00313C9D19
MEIQGLFAAQTQRQHQHGGACHPEQRAAAAAGLERLAPGPARTASGARPSPAGSGGGGGGGPKAAGQAGLESARLRGLERLLLPPPPGDGKAAGSREAGPEQQDEEGGGGGAGVKVNIPIFLIQEVTPPPQQDGGAAAAALKQPPPPPPPREGEGPPPSAGTSGGLNPKAADSEEFFVVFSIVQEAESEGERDAAKEGGAGERAPQQSGCFVSAAAADQLKTGRAAAFPPPPPPAAGRPPPPEAELPAGPEEASAGAANPGGRRPQGAGSSPDSAADCPGHPGGGAFGSESAAFSDPVPVPPYQVFPDPSSLLDNLAELGGGGAFSGTITINNQNLIVRIENGILTLAAPPDSGGGGGPGKGGGGRNGKLEMHAVALKEHLDFSHKDAGEVVLINCDQPNKISVEQACRLAEGGGGSLQNEDAEEPGMNDSSLASNGDSSFSDPNSTLDSGASQKDLEESALCTIDETDLICPEAGEGQLGNFIVAENGNFQVKLGEGLGLSKNGVVVVYHCSEPNCNKAFDKKHKLKMHLLSHTEGQRPFKCTLDGCGWSFTTSYKLKRHLQSHDKIRPFTCEVEGCGKKFTTVYNLKAHMKAHEQENSFKCEVCNEHFATATKLSTHQRSHFEPERPYKCDFPGCEKTFITVSALFSHNRSHFREQEQFSCSFSGCDKQYDKACRLKIHMRSHTGERPFVCDFEGCGWTFTSMSKLLRHKRKHEDDRRFTCPVEGCGKSFTRAEHLKGHSITHLGTKPFECPIEGCSAKFSARSSLYIHSKKHLQDTDALKTRCLVSSCNKLFTSKHSLKTHMIKQHNFSPDLLTQLEMTNSLTPSNELTSPGQGDLSNLDITSLFSSVPTSSSSISTDLSLVNSGILTIDAASVSTSLGGSISVSNSALGQTVDPLILAASTDLPHSLDSSLSLSTGATVLQQGTLNLDDMQTVNAEALGSLASLSLRTSSQDLNPLSSSGTLTIDTATLTLSSSLGSSHVPELLTPTKVDRNLLGNSDVISQQEGSNVVTQFVFNGPPGSYSAQKEQDLCTASGSSFLESGGSARTDYRAIQLAKKKKQRGGSTNGTGTTNSSQRKNKTGKVGSPASSSASQSCRFGGNVVLPNGGLAIRDPATGAQYVQIQLLQDDPGEGDLAFQLSTQSSTSHSQLTVDLPVNILQVKATSLASCH